MHSTVWPLDTKRIYWEQLQTVCEFKPLKFYAACLLTICFSRNRIFCALEENCACNKFPSHIHEGRVWHGNSSPDKPRSRVCGQGQKSFPNTPVDPILFHVSLLGILQQVREYPSEPGLLLRSGWEHPWTTAAARSFRRSRSASFGLVGKESFMAKVVDSVIEWL